MIRSFALHQWFFIIHVEFIDNAKVVKSRAWRWRVQCLLLKRSNEKDVCFPRVKQWDTARLASIKIETLSKKKKKEIEMTDPWSVHGWESGGLNKEMMNEMNLMHGHFLSCKIMHCITFVYYIKHISSSHLKQEGRVLHLIKASERPSRRKKIIQIDRSFNPLKIQPTGRPSVSLDENE